MESRFSLATLYLLQGQYDEGWKLYDSRLVWKEKFRLDIPIWQGENLTDHKILLFYEQGLGDTIHFIRYAYKVAALAQTTVWIQKPLKRLLASTQNAFAICDGSNIDPKKFDFACSLLSLPTKLGLPNNMLSSDAYLHVDGAISQKWHKIISPWTANQKKVGVVWAGNPEHADDHNRSIAWDLFSQLFTINAVAWISLQVGNAPQELTNSVGNLLDYSGDFFDYAETAGAIANLDLVIAVDTSVAHLAGALGKQTWLLLPYRPDWRWGLASENSPWYPTMRLFRQRKAGDWQEVLDRVKIALQKIL
jgi:hypothetical protein